ncbi:uncharacterized protein LOC119097962 [Pollicipes pollicipes]|uniref:uncharacterized protein LOC119097962 n=1 Tax=Pollicipes pollicipes TaxID=41117 RepID=UPI0018858A0D|nr:uncharacterized protein LOC119097962 [Pollicipes pollicipes]
MYRLVGTRPAARCDHQCSPGHPIYRPMGTWLAARCDHRYPPDIPADGHKACRRVSWIRRRDFHVLTSRSHVFTADERVSVQHRVAGDEDWALSIWPVTAADSGVYECQVSTGQGTLSRLVNLTVVEPIARILGTEVHRIEEGSVITLLCVIDQATSEVGPIQWWRNNRTLVASGRVTVQSSSDGTAGSPQSQLHIRRASFLDSGLYTCGGDHLLSATVQLFVTEGDKTAAIQRRSPAGSRAAPAQLTLLLLCWLVPR